MENKHELQSLIDMELFAVRDVSQSDDSFYRTLIRVPGGWIFESYRWGSKNDPPMPVTQIFVPVPLPQESKLAEESPFTMVPYSTEGETIAFIETKVADILDKKPYDIGGEAKIWFKFPDGQTRVSPGDLHPPM